MATWRGTCEHGSQAPARRARACLALAASIHAAALPGSGAGPRDGERGKRDGESGGRIQLMWTVAAQARNAQSGPTDGERGNATRRRWRGRGAAARHRIGGGGAIERDASERDVSECDAGERDADVVASIALHARYETSHENLRRHRRNWFDSIRGSGFEVRGRVEQFPTWGTGHDP